MINFHNLINGGAIGMPLIIIAFAVVYFVFYRDLDKRHKRRQEK
jgi:preprotein translocase subunit YajC